MPKDSRDMSEAELAEWQYAHRQELDAEEGELVDVEIARQLSVTMSFRLPGAEADAIRQAADAADMTLSEWIRQACADALDPAGNGSRRQTVDEELVKANQLVELLGRRLQRVAARNRAGSSADPGRTGRASLV